MAVDIPDEVKKAIAEFIATLKGACGRQPGIRWARVEGMHVTLKFVGEAAPERVEKIKAALAEVRSAQAVELRFRETGFFPNARHPRVFWAGIEASENLAEVAAEVEQRLDKIGIAREKRAFKPHLTLARFKPEEGVAELHAALAKMSAAEFGAARSGELHLYQSVLKPGGAEYTRLETFRFAGEMR